MGYARPRQPAIRQSVDVRPRRAVPLAAPAQGASPEVYDMVEQFDAKPAEIRPLLRGDLDPGRTQELLDEMRAAGLPT